MSLHPKDIIYFIVTDRFYEVPNPNKEIQDQLDRTDPLALHGGNFDGIIAKIPYLKKLGITALWITPVYLQLHLEKTKSYHGYWALDFNTVDPSLYIAKPEYAEGSKQYLKDLVDILHQNGIKLILDMVVNHVGYGHPALSNAEPNPTPIRKDWFHNDVSLNHCEVEGRLAGLPDMDLDRADVCDYHINTILSWIKETGVDVIRMDTVKHVEDGFWNYFKTQVKGKFPNTTIIGEVFVFDIDRISEYQKYWAFDSLFDFPFQDVVKKVFIEDAPLECFYSSFEQGYGLLEKDKAYTNHNRLVTLLDNHDLAARFMTSAMWEHNNNRVIAADLLKLALAFMFTSRGIPQLYYGTEIAMEGGHDPDNRRDFEWQVFDENYEVKEQYELEKQVFDYSRLLIAIRKQNEALSCGKLVCLFVDHFLFVYLRYIEDNIIIPVFFNGWQEMSDFVEVDINGNVNLPQRIKSLLNNTFLKCLITDEEVMTINGRFTLKMHSKTCMILKYRN